MFGNNKLDEIKHLLYSLTDEIVEQRKIIKQKNHIDINPRCRSLNHVEAINPKIVHELEKLREFLHGAHFTAENENASATLHQGCHKVDDLISLAKLE